MAARKPQTTEKERSYTPEQVRLLAKVISDACAADAIYQTCQAYPFRVFVSGQIHREDVQAAVEACLNEDV